MTAYCMLQIKTQLKVIHNIPVKFYMIMIIFTYVYVYFSIRTLKTITMTNAEINYRDPHKFIIKDSQIYTKQWIKLQYHLLLRKYPQDSGNITLLDFKSNT